MARRPVRSTRGGGREPPVNRRDEPRRPMGPRALLRGGDEPRGTVMPAVGHAGRRALGALAP